MTAVLQAAPSRHPIDTLPMLAWMRPWLRELSGGGRSHAPTTNWSAVYGELHVHWRHENSRRRKVAAEKARQRPSPDARSVHLPYVDRARGRAALVEGRLRAGFRWDGGDVGGEPRYRRAAFVHHGLVSERTPILQLFATKVPRAPRLMTGATKAKLDDTDSKLLALDSAYVEANKTMRGVLRVELDSDFDSWTALDQALAASGMPMPNIAVGHADGDGRVLRPHLLWLLRDSVAFTERARRGPQALFKALVRGLTVELAGLGADQGGLFNTMRVKNPLSPLWSHRVLRGEPYAMDELRATVPLDRAARLPGALGLNPPRPGSRSLLAGNPDLESAAGSNSMFRALSALAREMVPHPEARSARRFPAFEAMLLGHAERLMRQERGRDAHEPLTERVLRAAAATAGSVARWTWTTFKPRDAAARLPEGEREVRQAAAGRLTASKRGLDTLVTLLRALVEVPTGQRPTYETLAGMTGVSTRTLKKHAELIAAIVPEGLRERRARLAEALAARLRLNGEGRSPSDKKGVLGKTQAGTLPASGEDLASPPGFDIESAVSVAESLSLEQRGAPFGPASPTMSVPLDDELAAYGEEASTARGNTELACVHGAEIAAMEDFVMAERKNVIVHLAATASRETGENTWCAILRYGERQRVMQADGRGNAQAALVEGAGAVMRALKTPCAVAFHTSNPHLKDVSAKLPSLRKSMWLDAKPRGGTRQPIPDAESWKHLDEAATRGLHAMSWSYTRAVDAFGKMTEPGELDIEASRLAAARLAEVLGAAPVVPPAEEMVEDAAAYEMSDADFDYARAPRPRAA